MVMIPTVHLNGDTRETLHDQNYKVYLKAIELLDALQGAGPNGRNFYPQGADALWKAQIEHQARWQAVDKIKKEMEEIVQALME